ncbi:MAG: M42 family metallopeptidase [Candidatus Wukongarchaeota archaeon]|nr:M42 family metallopeptidase [Candidatus Wukongarchaeota archaeon]
MFNEKSISFLKRLSESFGPSGFEREPVKIVKEYVSEYVDEIIMDKMGSLIFKKEGEDKDGPRILLPGHVDEVGFIVSSITDEGYLTFNTLGGWFDQVLLSQRVQVRTMEGDLVFGVIASKPPHILPPEERNKVVKKSMMYIDVGCSSDKEVEKLGIRVGDPIVPYSEFTMFDRIKIIEDEKEKEKTGETTPQEKTVKMIAGKAFDDRIGAFVSAEVVRKLSEENIPHKNVVFGAATVQEEVGLRGARTTAHVVDPSVAIVLEVDIAGDVPGIKPNQAPSKLNKGVSIITYDASMVPNQPLKELVIRTAEEDNIPYQLSAVAGGGTDAGIIHISRAGCPSIVFGIPTRHIHSHVGIACLEDVKATIDLTIEVIKKLDREVVESLTAV